MFLTRLVIIMCKSVLIKCGFGTGIFKWRNRTEKRVQKQAHIHTEAYLMTEFVLEINLERMDISTIGYP